MAQRDLRDLKRDLADEQRDIRDRATDRRSQVNNAGQIVGLLGNSHTRSNLARGRAMANRQGAADRTAALRPYDAAKADIDRMLADLDRAKARLADAGASTTAALSPASSPTTPAFAPSPSPTPRPAPQPSVVPAPVPAPVFAPAPPPAPARSFPPLPPLQAEGHGGQLVLEPAAVRIERDGRLARMSGKPSLSIPIEQITGVEIAAPTALKNGHLQIHQIGHAPVSPAQDQNAVLFVRKQLPQFEQIKLALDSALASAVTAPSPSPSSVPPTPGRAEVDPAPAGIQPGWYADPQGMARERFPDGSGWTARIRM